MFKNFRDVKFEAFAEENPFPAGAAEPRERRKQAWTEETYFVSPLG
jgi:hypothetical protein